MGPTDTTAGTEGAPVAPDPDDRPAASLQGPTLTFLFTDIEGSTRLEQRLGTARYAELRERHRALLRAAFAAARGEEQGTEGDSFFVTFRSAHEAVAAAAAAQRALATEPWPDEAPVKVRMGIHSGEAQVRGGSLVGIDINRAARIGAAGHGGQVVVSATTRALVGEDPGPDLSWLDLGEHRLKDLEVSERLAQLRIGGLPSEFPRLRGTVGAGDLPVSLTTFVGRTAEIEQLSQLLGASRLLTLTGPGGTGKTRLALEVARRCEPWFPDGAWWVPLETIADAELVPATIAQRLRLADRGGADPRGRLEHHLQGKTLLLVLDNFEQVMGAGPLVAALLAATPTLKVLVTSREALHISGEQEYQVPPLSTPDPVERREHPERLADSEAVGLFVERARAVRPGYQPSPADIRAIAEVCYRLDGLPLAIELAAARIRLLSPQAIVGRLGQSLTLLAGGARDLPTRQQTLRGAIAWSHEMLEPADRRLFACFSVFAGRADLGSVEDVCGAPDVDVLDGLSSLVDKSLVRRGDTSDGEPGFDMFGTIRTYAAEQLTASGLADDARRRHAYHYLARVEALREAAEAGERDALDGLERDHDDLRAAIAWALETRDAAVAVGLVAGLWRFWQKRGYLVEGRQQAERVVAALGPDTPDDLRVAALDTLGGLAYWLGEQAEAQAPYARVLEIRRRQGDPRAIAEALYNLSFTYMFQADSPRGGEILDEAASIFEGIGDEAGLGRVLWARANLEWTTGDVGRTALAQQYALRALEVFERVGDRFMTAWSEYTAALGSMTADDRDDGRRRLTRALRIFQESGDVSGYTLVLDSVVALLQREGDLAAAARLAGQVSTLEQTTGTGLNAVNRAYYGYDPAQLANDPATVDAYAEGTRMPVDDAVALALDRLEHGARPG
jgi:predicted ATPase/class 3 adenylate cyclase